MYKGIKPSSHCLLTCPLRPIPTLLQAIVLSRLVSASLFRHLSGWQVRSLVPRSHALKQSLLVFNGSIIFEVAVFQFKCSFEKLNLNLALNFHRSTKPAILQNRCWRFVVFFRHSISLSFCPPFFIC